MSRHICPYNIPSCQGCLDDTVNADSQIEPSTPRSQVYSPNSDQSSGYDDDLSVYATSWSRSPTPNVFRSAQTVRTQLQEHFLHLYFPAADHDTDFMYSRFLSRDSIQPVVGLPMTAAVDALCLIQLAVSYSDNDLLHHAITRYDAAVAGVRVEVGKPGAVFDDGLLGAIYILGFCEMYSAISVNGVINRAHHRALQGMLLERGPHTEYSPFAQLLLYNFRHMSMCLGLAERKHVALMDPIWKKRAAITTGLVSELSDLMVRLPSLIHVVDTLNPESNRNDGLAETMIELVTYERDLQSWQVRWLRSFEGLPHWTIDVSTFDHFQQYSHDAPNIFDKAFEFPSFSSASVQMTYWISLLQIKQTILRVGSQKGSEGSYGLHGRARALVEEADECATNVCRSVAWLTQSKYGSCGIMRASGPLHYGARWFAKRKDAMRADWCRTVEKNILSRGIMFLWKNEPDLGSEQEGQTSPGSIDFSPT